MKKIALILIIALMSTFASAVVASDLGNKWWPYNPFRHFSGTYEMSASGSCIHSQNGYDYKSAIGWYVPKEGVVYSGTTVSNGTWVFKKDGTGTYSYVMYATVTPPVEEPPCLIPGGIRVFSESGLHFTYEISRFGDITIHTVEEGDTLEGNISIDRKAITLFDALREKGPGAAACPWWTIICTATRTLIKVND